MGRHRSRVAACTQPEGIHPRRTPGRGPRRKRVGRPTTRETPRPGNPCSTRPEPSGFPAGRCRQPHSPQHIVPPQRSGEPPARRRGSTAMGKNSKESPQSSISAPSRFFFIAAHDRRPQNRRGPAAKSRKLRSGMSALRRRPRQCAFASHGNRRRDPCERKRLNRWPAMSQFFLENQL